MKDAQSRPKTPERHHLRNRRGAMLVLIVLCLPVVLAFGVFAINVAWMQLTRTELRTATDASVKAGSRMLSLSQDPAEARKWAINAAKKNNVAGSPLLVRDSEVVFGSGVENSDGGYDFVPRSDTSKLLTSVEVTGSRGTGSLSGSVPLLFNGLFDTTTFQPIKKAVATQIDRDVALVVDRSGSMGYSTGSGTRWSALRSAVDGFLDELNNTPQDEKVALCSYSTWATLDEPVTLKYDTIKKKIAKLTVAGGTGIGRGLEKGIAAVTDPGKTRALAAKTIVIMTDGNHNRGPDPEGIATQAAGLGITVHTITFSAGANQAHMQRVANNGGGKHWHADDEASLVTVFREVANNLPTLLTH